MDERELSLAVVGIDYPNEDKAKSNRRFEMALCKPGDPVELRREPKHKMDPHAVAVFSERGVQLGYLTAERAPWIGGKILAGEEVRAIFQEMAGAGGVIRARFGGEAPTLPRRPGGYAAPQQFPIARLPKERPAAGLDFYPDPDGPEWGA